MPEQNKYPAHEKLAESFMTINYSDAVYGANVHDMAKEFQALLAKQEEDAGFIREIVKALELCDRGFKSGRLEDQSIIPTDCGNAKEVKLEVLSEIVESAISKAQIRLREGV